MIPLYLDLLKRSLIDALNPTTYRAVSQGDGSVKVEPVPEEERSRRLIGEDWPANACTMIGLARLDSLQTCIETIVEEDIPGDLIETGVWRGGAVIFMCAVLDALGDSRRKVYAADSFAGLPPGDEQKYPADAGDLHHTVDFLAASLDDVKRNFARYSISTERVRFLKGWFRDTLPGLDNQWALVRLDGDMYESTMVAFESLYPRLTPGGFLVVDDYLVPGASKATADYRQLHGIDADPIPIDDAAVFWRKP